MDTKITKFLGRRFAIMVVVCIAIFSALTAFMSKRTDQAVNEITNIYISEINGQIKQKFSSVSQLRIDQVTATIHRTPPETAENPHECLEDLKFSAEVRGFSWLGLYVDENNIETIYGDKVEVYDDALLDQLKNTGNIITYGYDKNEEKLFVFGVGAKYPLPDGSTSAAMLAAVPMEYLDQALFKNEKDQKVYSHLIDNEGNFIIRSGAAYRNNYFNRLSSIVREMNGKKPEDYVEELRDSMQKKKDFNTVLYAEDELRHVYCSALNDNSNWFVVTVIPDKIFGDIITSLNRSRNDVMILSIILLLLFFSVTFYQYFRFSQNQMKMLERSRIEAQKASMAKTDFLSSMSHDIRTPMNAIVGMTEIAEKNIGDNLRIEDCLKKIKLSSKHLLGLINDVLDMSKIESGKLSLNIAPMSLRDTMDDIVNIIKPQIKDRHQYFDIYIHDIISEDVYCDSVRMNQVLLNLLSNALKFTHEKGRIDVFVWQEPSKLGDEYVRTHFVVQDNGIGMSKEFQKKIFESFEREENELVIKTTGAGLGMAITKSIIDIMGGTIVVESEINKGSKFHVTLDLKSSEIREKDMVLPEWNILVVDDDERLCHSAVAILEEMGTHPEWTTDGRKAIEMTEERHKNNNPYRIILIDWQMPHLDGIETIREIHRRVGTEIPVFLISAYDWNDVKEVVSITDNIEGFIAKPLFKSTLYMNLSRYKETDDHHIEMTEESESDETACFEGKRVLMSEDIDLNWEIAYEILSEFGLELDRAVNGKECVEMFTKTEIGYYDAILMDIRMPVMNGYEATRVIRALDRADHTLPIIAITADAFSDDAQRCIECGMDAHISKPIDIKECQRILSQYLNGNASNQ